MEMNNTIEYYGVYNENTLGYVFIDTSGVKRFGILQASVLRGSHFNLMSDPLYISPVYNLRKATAQDFNDFRVVVPYDFNQFNN